MNRIRTSVAVSALIRRVNAQGGSAMVLGKGDADAGGILVLTYEKGANPRFFERGMGPDGHITLIRSGPREGEDEMAISDYWQRRRSRDPDLWVVELDIAEAERFAAETILQD